MCDVKASTQRVDRVEKDVLGEPSGEAAHQLDRVDREGHGSVLGGDDDVLHAPSANSRSISTHPTD